MNNAWGSQKENGKLHILFLHVPGFPIFRV